MAPCSWTVSLPRMPEQRHLIEDLCILISADQRRLGVQVPGQAPRWGPPLPPPIRLVLHADDVAYHQLWSGIPEVALPRWQGARLRLWLVDGEDQPLYVDVTKDGTVTLR